MLKREGIKSTLLCALAGGLLVLSSPGINIWPAAFAAFAVIFWILDRADIKQWKAMWLTGFVYHLFTTMWVHIPVNIFGGAPVPVGIIIALAVAVVTSLIFWAPLGVVAKRTNNSILLFAMVLVALELAKGKYYMGGMPWLNIGQTQYNNILTLQLASIIGENGISFLVVLGGGCLYKLITDISARKRWLCSTVFMLFILFGFGKLALMMDKTPDASYTVRLVQTGIKQEDKWDYAKRQDVYTALMTGISSAAAMDGEYDLMLLPESTFNVNPFTSEDIMALLDKISTGHSVIFSNDRMVTYESGNRALYNSMFIMADGKITDTYDKMKLVPFGEYFPFEKQLSPIKTFFFGNAELFSPGQAPAVFVHNDIRIAPLICFEASFSELTRQRIQMGANVLAVSSNESWFGDSLGRQQRLAMDVLRAVEYKRYLLRSTQDGISTVIDPYGRLLTRFPEKQYHAEDVNFALINGQTFFAWASYSWYMLVILAYALTLVYKRKNTQG